MQIDEQKISAPDMEASTRDLLDTFYTTLDAQITGSGVTQTRIETIRARAAALEAAHQDWVVDEPARYNLKMTAALLAAYQGLKEFLTRETLLKTLHEALVAPWQGFVRDGTRQMLDQSPDPFRTLTGISKGKEVNAYGAGFIFEHPRDDDQAYFADVQRCFYHEFFAANGAPELTSIFCAFDAPWIEAIDPDRHGVRFERSTTIGTGGTICPFHFYRTGRKTGHEPASDGSGAAQ